ncbi:MAG: S24/S26 family peptidase [Prevotella sp.]|nr:S24/S26 family peptidase [Prevotella sp.]
MEFPNHILIPELRRLLDEGHATVTLPLRGRSMRPFLEDGRDKALLALPESLHGGCLQVGDAVLAEVMPRRYVLHRLIAIDGDALTLLGDGNLSTEHCRRQDVVAVALGFFRKGRQTADMVTGRKWRCYSWLWMRLRPVRRYLLFAFHPHVPRMFQSNRNQ